MPSLAPAWSLLDMEGIRALLVVPERGLPEAVRMRCVASQDALAAVPLIAATRLLIERAVVQDGLNLTATGMLSRADTRALFDAISWPDFDKDQVLRFNKVLNEPDVHPVHVTRVLAKEAKLLRRRGRKLLATKAAKSLLAPDGSETLFRLLFETTLWRVNLGHFDGIPVEGWPQDHIGVALWGLSVAGRDWADAQTLARVCTMMDERLAGRADDYPGFAMATRVLRPLMWFGLVESRQAGDAEQPAWRRPLHYRTTALFDAVLDLGVTVKSPSGPLH